MQQRITKYKHLHSNRFRYLYSSIPLYLASGSLLVVCSMMLMCLGVSNSNSLVYALDNGIEELADTDFFTREYILNNDVRKREFDINEVGHRIRKFMINT